MISDEWAVLPHLDFTSYEQKVLVDAEALWWHGMVWTVLPPASLNPFRATLAEGEADPSHRQALDRDL